MPDSSPKPDPIRNLLEEGHKPLHRSGTFTLLQSILSNLLDFALNDAMHKFSYVEFKAPDRDILTAAQETSALAHAVGHTLALLELQADLTSGERDLLSTFNADLQRGLECGRNQIVTEGTEYHARAQAASHLIRRPK